jgi:hypothetical protein
VGLEGGGPPLTANQFHLLITFFLLSIYFYFYSNIVCCAIQLEAFMASLCDDGLFACSTRGIDLGDDAIRPDSRPLRKRFPCPR